MKPKESSELAQRYRSMSTDDLVKAATVGRKDSLIFSEGRFGLGKEGEEGVRVG